MSRLDFTGERYGIAFGRDHDPVIGNFVQVWDLSIAPDPDVDSTIVDLDGFSGCVVTVALVMKLAKKYEVIVDEKEVTRLIALGL